MWLKPSLRKAKVKIEGINQDKEYKLNGTRKV
jgi:hypothetical protein